MSQFSLVNWDSERLVVNREFEPILRAAGLTTFDAFWNFTGGTIAKNLLKERTTTRVVVQAEGREYAFFLKRHTRPPWKEYLKPLFRLARPIIGARPEWEAILKFHQAGIATMTPVVLGESGGRSFLLTAAIEGCCKLSLRMNEVRRTDAPHNCHADRPIVRAIARAARIMHSAGLHHQDFYLTHLMIPESGNADPLYVIDLGRVRSAKRLAQRWIIKDLAQLNYSADRASRSERIRFLREYLGRRLSRADRRLIARIERKTARIARHSRKNAL